MPAAFDFGSNWEAFSAEKLDVQRLRAASQSLRDLVGSEEIKGRSFLDVGCGSGLFSIAAAECGAAYVLGFDANATAVKVSKENAARLEDHLGAVTRPDFRVGDVLDARFVGQLGTFDIVYAWGSLHHTGSMWQAIQNASSLVEPDNGMFVIAIYNRHWTSHIWKQIKRLYNRSPWLLRTVSNYLFGLMIYVRVRLVTGKSPLQKERGMDFRYDVIDWLGGYPYEYASIAEVVSFVQSLGFDTRRVLQTVGWTGCNEFVFEHRGGCAQPVEHAISIRRKTGA